MPNNDVVSEIILSRNKTTNHTKTTWLWLWIQRSDWSASCKLCASVVSENAKRAQERGVGHCGSQYSPQWQGFRRLGVGVSVDEHAYTAVH